MCRKIFLLIVLPVYIALVSLGQLCAQEEESEIIIISERVSKEIDQEERDKFKLFQEVKGFQSAVYIKLPDNRYFLKITYLDEKTGELKIARSQQSELSIKNRGDYIDRFEEIQVEKQQFQDLSKPQTGPGTAFYLELGGKLWGSLNADFRINLRPNQVIRCRKSH